MAARLRLLAASLLLLLAAAGAAHAQAPAVRIVVPAPPGGALDASARLFALRMAALTGEPHVVENRPGANTAIGTEFVMRSAPDGRVMLFTGASIVTNAWMNKGGVSALEGLQPVVQLSNERYWLVSAPGSGASSVRDLEQAPASRPGGWNCAAVPGATTMACEQLRARSGGAVVTVPYAGLAQALNALQGGHVDIMFSNIDAVARVVQAGRLRVLAASARGEGAADAVPLFAQAWPDFLMEGAYGVFVPIHTPAARVQQLNREFNQVLAEPEVGERMREAGQEVVGGDAAGYLARLRLLEKRSGELARRLGLARP